MNESEQRFRQIHLDFHTSEHLTGIGSAFDPEEFADTLVKARVNSITCFARCHHGWLYYDSKAHPERIHPHLRRNLLKEQIEACHARGIRVPVYTTIQWDYFTADQNPDWVALTEDGDIQGDGPFQAGFYSVLCVNSPYMDFLKRHVQEILETFPVDGLFLDIVHPLDDSSKWTRDAMWEAGLEPADQVQRRQFGLSVINQFRRDMTAFIRKYNHECTIFYNQGHIGPQHRETTETFTHWELESLPSGGWGYMHFPLAVRYARTLSHDYLGMTGKFHTSWGDFHSFKNAPALAFECNRMLAHAAKCSIGDQLAPEGQIDHHVYELIGSIYQEVERKEPWCVGAKPVVEIGVFTPEEFAEPFSRNLSLSLMGATRMLEQAGHQFDIIDSNSDFSVYRLLILPDEILLTDAVAAKLEAFLAAGGAIIASFESGMGVDKVDFILDGLGVHLKGNGPRDLDGNLVRGRYYPKADYVEYILPEADLGEGLPATEHAMYIRGTEIEARDGSTVLGHIIPSYFDRTYRHFHSHRQTSSSGQRGNPGVVQCGSVIYFSNPIFSQYERNAPRWVKVMFLNAMNRLLPEPLVRLEGPSTLQVTLNEQPQHGRWVLHLLHYIPERRSEDFDTIEDIIPLYNVPISIRTPKRVSAVAMVPDETSLPFAVDNGRVEFTLPELHGHQMIVLTFEA